MSDVTLRPVAPGDAEAMAKLHVETWEAAYRGMVPDGVLERNGLEQRRLLWRGLLVEAERLPLVDVALVEAGASGQQELAGFVWSRRIDQPDAAFAAEIVALNVRPESWRRGIGRRLMAAAAARLEGLGAGSVYLWVFRENSGARAFYEALGGRIVDQDVERFGEVSLPRIAYAWKPMSRLHAAMQP